MSEAATHAARARRPAARPVSRPHDRDEREAGRAADVVARGGSVAGWSFSSLPVSTPAPVQRQEAGAPKAEDEKYKEAAAKAGEAALATPEGKALKETVLADPVVKTVKDAITSPGGLVAIAGGVAALAATGKELPIQPPAFSLERITPGLSGKVTYQGPVNAPTFVGLTLTYKEQVPKGRESKKAGEAYREETARLAAGQEQFRRGLTFAPGSKEAEEQRLADEAIARWVTRPGIPGVTIPLSEPKREELSPVQRAPASSAGEGPTHADVGDALATPGRPLDPATRRSMESRFGYDFSAVRVHDDARAAATAAEIQATAFTVGQDVVFGTGEYAPSTSGGRELLAHELAHTIQQRGPQGKAPPLAPGSEVESTAEAAGRAAASGSAVAQPLGRSGVRVARQRRGARYLSEQDLYREALRVLQRLNQGSYPRREEDLRWAQKLAEEIQRRERVKAVTEAKWVAEQMSEPTAEEAPAEAPAPEREPPSKFAPGGFTDEEVEREYKAATERLDAELAPPRVSGSFEERLAKARWGADYTGIAGTQDRAYPYAVYTYGRNAGLFASYERDRVYETLGAPAREKTAATTRRLKVEAAVQQRRQFESFRAQMNLLPIQATLTGGVGAFGRAAKAAYNVYSYADTAVQTHRAIQSGSPTDVVGAVLPLAAGRVTKRMLGVSEPAPRLPGARAPGGGASGGAGGGVAEAVTPNQVRQAYRASPHSVQKSTGNEWHQQQWERNGGTGPAPIAFRAGDMIRVNEVRWLAVGDLSEINAPGDLRPARVPPPSGARIRSPAAFEKTAPPEAVAETAPAPPAAAPPQPVPPSRQTQLSLPPTPRAPAVQGPRGYTPVLPEVAGEAYRIDPRSIVQSGSTNFHQMVWEHGGGTGTAPLAFRVGSQVRVDIERWPTGQRAAIGVPEMKLPEP